MKRKMEQYFYRGHYVDNMKIVEYIIGNAGILNCSGVIALKWEQCLYVLILLLSKQDYFITLTEEKLFSYPLCAYEEARKF